MPRETRGQAAERLGQDIGGDQVVRPAQAQRRGLEAMAAQGAHQRPHAIDVGVLSRHGDRRLVGVGGQHRHAPEARHGHGEDAAAAAEIQRPPHLAALAPQPVQGQQAALGGLVAAGAEGHAGIQQDRLAAPRRLAGEMRAMDKEAAGADRRMEPLALRHPVLRRQVIEAGHGRAEAAERRQHLTAVGARLAQRLDAPGLAAGGLEAGERRTHGLQVGFDRQPQVLLRGRDDQPDGPDAARLLRTRRARRRLRSGGHQRTRSAGTTKLASTFLLPALSNSISSLSPSAVITVP